MIPFRSYPPERRWTSMCMEIAPFTHVDCPAPSWCNCACHRMQDLADALGALTVEERS